MALKRTIPASDQHLKRSLGCATLYLDDLQSMVEAIQGAAHERLNNDVGGSATLRPILEPLAQIRITLANNTMAESVDDLRRASKRELQVVYVHCLRPDVQIMCSQVRAHVSAAIDDPAARELVDDIVHLAKRRGRVLLPTNLPWLHAFVLGFALIIVVSWMFGRVSVLPVVTTGIAAVSSAIQVYIGYMHGAVKIVNRTYREHEDLKLRARLEGGNVFLAGFAGALAAFVLQRLFS